MFITFSSTKPERTGYYFYRDNLTEPPLFVWVAITLYGSKVYFPRENVVIPFRNYLPEGLWSEPIEYDYPG